MTLYEQANDVRPRAEKLRKSDGEFQRIRKGSSPFVGGIEMLDAEKEEQTTLFSATQNNCFVMCHPSSSKCSHTVLDP